MCLGPKCDDIACATLLTITEKHGLDKPKEYAVFLSLRSSDK